MTLSHVFLLIQFQKSSYKISEIGDQTVDDQETDQQRQHILEVESQTPRHFDPLSYICLLNIILKAPSELPRAEKCRDQGTDRRGVLADQSVIDL